MVSDEEIQRILNASQHVNSNLSYYNDDLLEEDLLIPGEDGMPQCANFELRGKGYRLLAANQGAEIDEAQEDEIAYLKRVYGYEANI